MGLGDIFKIGQFKAEIEQLKESNQQLQSQNAELKNQLQEMGALDYYKIKEMTEQLEKEHSQRIDHLKSDYENQENLLTNDLNSKIKALEETISEKENKKQRNSF